MSAILATLLLALGAMAALPAGAAAAAQSEDAATTAASISTSHSHTCVLLSDDTVACWGDNDQGQSAPPKATFREVSAGGRLHTCGIMTNGMVACWGYDNDGQASPPEGTFRQVDTGTTHSCGIKTDGTLACWGNDEAGQSEPPEGTFRQVSAGDAHTCAIRTDGTVACWGQDGDGRATPPMGTFRQVSAGETATCGIKSDGRVACWGASADAQTAPPDGTFVQISVGDGHACGLRTSGSLACWGADDYKQASPPFGTFLAVSAGYLHSCALATNATAACWGFESAATKVPDKLVLGRVTASAGGTFSCGVQAAGGAVCWGSNAAGEGTAPPGTFSQVSSGPDHSCGLRSDGTVACWGANAKGQSAPPPGAFSQLTAGGSHSCAIAADGTAVCWGDDGEGQSTPPTGAFSQISAGDAHTCALADDGSVACWGENEGGQSTPPPGTFSQVSAGFGQTCAVRTDGSVTCWGMDDSAQAAPPQGAFIQVSAAEGYACGLSATGRVACWGAEALGTMTPPSDEFLEVSAGTGHACGLRAGGLRSCWGDDSLGQSSPPVPGAPVVSVALPDQTATQGSDFSFTFPESTFTDPNKLNLSYAASKADGSPLPGWIHLDAGNRSFRGKPADQDVGSVSITVTATNPKKLSASAAFRLTVADANDPPALARPVPDQAAAQGRAFALALPAGTFTDADLDTGDALALDAKLGDGSALPAWLSFDPAAGAFAGTPGDADVGSLGVTVTATDRGAASASDTFAVVVANANDAPLLARPLADQAARQGDAFSLALAADAFSDADLDSGDRLALSAARADGSPLPAWLRFDAGRRAFAGVPGDADVGAVPVVVTATDAAGAAASGAFAVAVANANDPPTVAAAIPDQGAAEDGRFSLAVPAGTFADLDLDSGDALALSAARDDGTALPAWLTFDAASATLGGTPRAGDVGSLGVRVTATDGSGATASDGFTLRVAHTNHPPAVAAPIPAQGATQDRPFSFAFPAGTFADPDAGDSVTYEASLADGSQLPTWLRFDRGARSFQGTPRDAQVGDTEVSVTATDRAGLSASAAFRLTVADANDPPALARPVPDQAAAQGRAFALALPAGTFTDADLDTGDALALDAKLGDGSALPAWLSFDPAAGAFAGTPGDADVGSLGVTVTATDRGAASASDTFAVVVANANDAPLLARPLADQAARQGDAFSLALAADAFSDADLDSGDRLALSAARADGSPLPAWLRFDAGRRAFAGVPGDADVGAVPVVVTATDAAGAAASGAFAVAVANANDPPTVAAAIPDQGAAEDGRFSLAVPAGTFADLDLDSGDALALSAARDDGTALPAWLTFDAASATLGGTPRAGDVGSLGVRVTATDGSGATASDGFTLRVAHTNHPPAVAAPIPAQGATQDRPFSFAFPAGTFADPDAGDSVTYEASLADGSQLPTWLRFDRGARSFQGTPRDAQVGDTEVSVTATDRAGLSASAAFRLTVADANDPPALARPVPDQAAAQGRAFALALPAGTFTDADLDTGDALALDAKLGDGSALPAWLSFDPAAGAFAGTPGDADVGSLGVTVTATDRGAASASDTFAVVVANANDAPTIVDAIPDQLATQNQAFTHTVPSDAVADAPSDVAAGDTLTYSASLEDGSALPAWLAFDPVTRTFAGTPLTPDVGAASIKLTATDSAGASVSDTFAITTIASHDDPTAPVVSLRRGKSVGLDGTIPVLIDWSAGLEAQKGGRPAYRLQLRKGTGLKWSAWAPYATARGQTGILKVLPPGHLQLRIQVSSPKVGPWVDGPPFMVSLLSERDPSIAYTGDWTSVADKTATGGTAKGSTRVGSTATVSADAETFALVMVGGSSMGVVGACVDPGTPTQDCRTLDLGAYGTSVRLLVLLFGGLAPGSHTMQLTVIDGQAILDGVVVLGQQEPLSP